MSFLLLTINTAQHCPHFHKFCLCFSPFNVTFWVVTGNSLSALVRDINKGQFKLAFHSELYTCLGSFLFPSCHKKTFSPVQVEKENSFDSIKKNSPLSKNQISLNDQAVWYTHYTQYKQIRTECFGLLSKFTVRSWHRHFFILFLSYNEQDSPYILLWDSPSWMIQLE